MPENCHQLLGINVQDRYTKNLALNAPFLSHKYLNVGKRKPNQQLKLLRFFLQLKKKLKIQSLFNFTLVFQLTKAQLSINPFGFYVQCITLFLDDCTMAAAVL